jgi:hypothetical protein
MERGRAARCVRRADTVRNPNYVTVDASRDRLDLAHEAAALESALDAAESIDAKNSLEKMLAHQLAAGHRSHACEIARLPVHLRNKLHGRRDGGQAIVAGGMKAGGSGKTGGGRGRK